MTNEVCLNRRQPPIRDIFIKPIMFCETTEPPLHRWDSGLCDSPCPRKPTRSVVQGLDKQPTLPKRLIGSLGQVNAVQFEQSPIGTTAPRKPVRSVTPTNQRPDPSVPCQLSPQTPNPNAKSCCPRTHPSFLASRPAGPPRVPRRHLNRTTGFDIDSIPLIPISLDADGSVKEDFARPLSEVITFKHLESGEKDVTVVFAIRRPGCGNCREHGLQLTELAAKHNINLIGSIKHTGVDDDALVSFYENYFKFPLYKDDNWDLYHALGNRKLSVWKLLSNIPQANKRYKEKKIENIPFGGDLFTQGGVLIFDKEGKLCFVYYEKYNEELDHEAIAWAIAETRKSG